MRPSHLVFLLLVPCVLGGDDTTTEVATVKPGGGGFFYCLKLVGKASKIIALSIKGSVAEIGKCYGTNLKSSTANELSQKFVSLGVAAIMALFNWAYLVYQAKPICLTKKLVQAVLDLKKVIQQIKENGCRKQ